MASGGCDARSFPESQPPVGRGASVSVPVAPSRPITQTGNSSSSTAVNNLISKDVAIQTPAATVRFEVAKRPGRGITGTKCLVRSNHFLVKVAADKGLYHYNVTITPKVHKYMNRNIISQLEKMHYLNTKTAYDGMQSLYTAGALKFMEEVFDVELDRPKRKFKVEIKMISRQETINNQALNIVLRHFPTNNTDFTVVGRSFFSNKPATKLGDGFEYWKAYYHSIRPTQMGLTLNLDVSAKVFYEPICVTDFIAKYCVKDITKPLSDQACIKVKKAVEGIKVKVTHRKTERSGYRITGITNQMSSEVTFLFRGTQISVAEYYSQLYGPLKYPHLPCLQAGSEKKRIDLPMEVCIIEEGQRFSKKLNENNLLKATGKGPVDREKTIREMVEQKHFRDDFVKNFGIKVSDQCTSIDARVLATPTLRYLGSDYNPQKGQWDMNDKKMIDGATVERWTYVNFSRKLPKGAVSHFCDKLIEKCCERGMVFSESPVVPPILSADPEQIKKTLKDMHKQCPLHHFTCYATNFEHCRTSNVHLYYFKY